MLLVPEAPVSVVPKPPSVADSYRLLDDIPTVLTFSVNEEGVYTLTEY